MCLGPRVSAPAALEVAPPTSNHSELHVAPPIRNDPQLRAKPPAGAKPRTNYRHRTPHVPTPGRMSGFPRIPSAGRTGSKRGTRGGCPEGRPSSAGPERAPPTPLRRSLRHGSTPNVNNASKDEEAISLRLSQVLEGQRTATYRPLCGGEYVGRYLSRVYDATKGRYQASKQRAFPIMDLPPDCMLKVLSYLSPVERGQCGRVCRAWNSLVRTPSLWREVDLTAWPLCTDDSHGNCGAECYRRYCTRLKAFMAFLVGIQPVLRSLSFAFDISEREDGWVDDVEELLVHSRTHELVKARVNWKETPVKPFWVEQTAWSVPDYNEFMHRHRHRQRRFTQLFDLLTAQAPNLTHLALPFDWSTRSLSMMTRLHRLHTLVLEKYFVFQQLHQGALDALLGALPSLERLVLEVWTPSGKGLILYSVSHPKLRYLDVSHCRGFYLGSLNLPDLQVFKVTRHPWNGPLTCADSIYIPCIHEVLINGASGLKQLNEHTLREAWQDTAPYNELNTVLQAVCSCRRHKSGWSM